FVVSLLFLLYSHCLRCDLPSFPTRRSSDLVSKLAICQIAVAFFGRSHPRAEMNLVDRNRRFEPILRATLAHPLLVAPEIPVDVRSEEHTSELQSRVDLVCRLLLEKKK